VGPRGARGAWRGAVAARALAGAAAALHIWTALPRERQAARPLRRGSLHPRSGASGRRHATHLEREGLAMKLNKNLGMLLLGIYLILHGLNSLLKLDVPALNTILLLLILVSGVVILLFDKAGT
jgi:hypothetical protein